jgi:hypothetical protein
VSDITRQRSEALTRLRSESLRLAVDLYAGRSFIPVEEGVIATAGLFLGWLDAKPRRLVLTVSPITFEQGHPALHHRTKRTGDKMSVTMTDDQEVTYSVQAQDDKGNAVGDTLTWSSDDAGAVVTLTPSADTLSCLFASVNPGTANISVTDGTLSAADSIVVTAGAAASLVLTPGTPVAETPAAV